ncbi:metallophosphoesterase [Portibacter lacus]|uniref:Phosphoesterase n=1 Tax=Portibacter lacus TaxID=1099794 RepID=A0AA37SQU8_9BACT|nr:metallophosphoesterase [Portibacter lacus]GLR18160.1 phosphoesterase [Portibacter lacus]
MNRLPIFIIFSAFFLLLSYFAFSSIDFIFDQHVLAKSIFGSLVIIAVFGIYRGLNQFTGKPRTRGANFLIGFAFSFFISVLIYSIGLLIQNIIKGAVAMAMWDRSIYEHPIFWSNVAIFAIVVVLFLSMIYGITGGKYNYTVANVKVKIKNLPEVFRGFKVAQISDIHSGTFDSVQQVKKGVDLINAQSPDLFLFTGDLVNFNKDEIDPYIDTFSKIEAPFGKFSILGNHDYYGMAAVPENQRGSYWKEFDQKHELIGFELLRNENRRIAKDGQHFNLIGVENWGTGGFPKTGDLTKAMIGMDTEKPSILMSHDPSHWEHHVLKTKQIIDLTLSGHTHAMQFGINTKWLKWSPVKYRYKRWMGMYQENERQLYVNRGFGFLGFPGRVFMWPEITIFELEPMK